MDFKTLYELSLRKTIMKLIRQNNDSLLVQLPTLEQMQLTLYLLENETERLQRAFHLGIWLRTIEMIRVSFIYIPISNKQSALNTQLGCQYKTF